MIRRYFLWTLFFVILIYIIKNVIELFTAENTPPQELINPEDLVPDTMFCPKCNQSYKEGITECPNCKVPTASFEETIEAKNNDGTNLSESFIKVFMANSEIQSRMIQMKLDESGIDSILESNSAASILAFGDESLESVGILVPEKDQDQARKIIQTYLENPDSKNQQA